MFNNLKIEEIPSFTKKILEEVKSKKIQFILLSGDIGSGKTTLTKEIGKQLNEKKEIVSPTFNFINIYKHFIHIDAYNLKGSSLEEFIDYFENKIIIIEWWENFNFNFENYLSIKIKIINENERKYIINYKK
ncbi:MAG: tRNA (adenosine(37)-N6)-threonylcarbamoyltransferase complex ATPase subunit type 1 TsaE [Metamycoplasmataceae bacterium]